MSFLLDLAAGLSSGLGKGIYDEAQYDEKIAAQQALDRQRANERLDLQRQRAMDNLDRDAQRAADQAALRLTLADMRAGANERSGEGKGGSGTNFFDMLTQARTPGEQSVLINAVRTMAGDDAADRVADTMYQRPRMSTTSPTSGDFARFDRMPEEDQALAAVPKSEMTPAQYSKARGTQALQRLYTLLLDPGKTDDFAKAEGQYGRNDLAAIGLGRDMADGVDVNEAADNFNKITNPAQHSPTADDRLDLTRTEADRKRGAQAASDLNRQAETARKALKDAQEALTKAPGAAVAATDPSKKAARVAAENAVAQARRDLDDITALQRQRRSGGGVSGADPAPAATPTGGPRSAARDALDRWRQQRQQ